MNKPGSSFRPFCKTILFATALAGLFLATGSTSAGATANGSLQLTLPPTWYGVPGVPVSVYYDNVVLTEKPESFKFSVKCDIGKAEARRWAVTPAETDAGDHAFEITVSDSEGKVIGRAKNIFRVAAKSAGAGGKLRLLIVGDSLTHATIYPNEIARLLSAPGNPPWTMLGTHKPASVAPGVAHEGYGGWTWNTFLTKYDAKTEHKLDEKGRRNSSPFVYPAADGKPALDIPRYIREECGNEPPDVVTFLLGINDCFHINIEDSKAVESTISTTLDTADKLLSAFHAAAPRAAMAVGLTTPPNSREEGFQANYKGKYTRWGWKRIQHRLVQREIERLTGRERENIFIVPTELNLDPVDGYPVNNGVHPNAAGYQQVGASFYCWIKSWLQARSQ
jgi:lysophospholipase L1-like esterase